MPPTTVEQRQYIIANAACPICIDDLVLITRTAYDFEAGWALRWPSGVEASRIKTYRVLDINTDGYVLSYDIGKHATFPWFVLEKVNTRRSYNFKPFDRVLVRDYSDCEWRPKFFGKYSDEVGVITIEGTPYRYCIPYEGNEHLAYTPNPANTPKGSDDE